jgi:hypothetical protein
VLGIFLVAEMALTEESLFRSDLPERCKDNGDESLVHTTQQKRKSPPIRQLNDEGDDGLRSAVKDLQLLPVRRPSYNTKVIVPRQPVAYNS